MQKPEKKKYPPAIPDTDLWGILVTSSVLFDTTYQKKDASPEAIGFLLSDTVLG